MSKSFLSGKRGAGLDLISHFLIIDVILPNYAPKGQTQKSDEFNSQKLNNMLFIDDKTSDWRRGRVVDGGGLENRKEQKQKPDEEPISRR